MTPWRRAEQRQTEIKAVPIRRCGLAVESHNHAGAARLGGWLERLPDNKAVGFGERRHHRTVLGRERRRDVAVRALAQGRAQIIGALVVGGEVAAEHRVFGRLARGRCVRRAAGSAAPETERRTHRRRPGCRAGRARAWRRACRASAGGRAASRLSRTRAPCPRRRTPSAPYRIRRPRRHRSSPGYRRRIRGRGAPWR